jgi:DNA-binding MarR family transcriptional regulator
LSEAKPDNDMARLGGSLVPKKVVKAKLGKKPSETALKIVKILDIEEYLTVKLMAKKLKITASGVGYGVRELEKNGYIWNLDEPKKRGVRYGLTAKGDSLAKELAKEMQESQSAQPSTAWHYEHHGRTKGKKRLANVKLPKDAPLWNRVALSFLVNDPQQWNGLVKTVLTKSSVETKTQLAHWLHVIVKMGFLKLTGNVKVEEYQLTEPGVAWAERVGGAYHMATYCEFCGKTILPYDPGWEKPPRRAFCSVKCEDSWNIKEN